jgi:deoxyribodipyrimidine photolyase-like uncharacterized protein
MPTTDFFQRNRKLKTPQIRRHFEPKGGEWSFSTSHGSKARLSLLAALTRDARQDGSLRKEEDYVMDATPGLKYPGKTSSDDRVHWNVAYQGKEYAPDEFVEKFPSFTCKYTWGGRGTKPKCVKSGKSRRDDFGRPLGMKQGDKKSFSIFGE